MQFHCDQYRDKQFELGVELEWFLLIKELNGRRLKIQSGNRLEGIHSMRIITK